MSVRNPSASDLIGYLTFSRRTHRMTLMLCGEDGTPQRVLTLVPMGPLAQLMRRVLVWLGLGGQCYRVITRDANDSRSFRVWRTADNGIALTDELGEIWLRSTSGHYDAMAQPQNQSATERRGQSRSNAVIVLPNPEIIKVVRRYGYGDASLN